jgi:hypothetical protein
MIYGEAFIDNQAHMQLVLNYPDGSKRKPITVADKSEAERWVYFYNRTYIKDTLTHWLGQRMNVFAHVNDNGRANTAEILRSRVNKYKNTSLHQVCQLIVDSETIIGQVAPGEKSRHFKTYELLIIPIIRFCREMKGLDNG